LRQIGNYGGGVLMNPEVIKFQIKHIEEAISHIGAKVADAVELSKKA